MLETIGKIKTFKKGTIIKENINFTKRFHITETKKILILKKGSDYFLVVENKQPDKIFRSKSVQNLIKQLSEVEDFTTFIHIGSKIEDKVLLHTEGYFLDKNWVRGPDQEKFKLDATKDGLYKIQANGYSLEKLIKMSEIKKILCNDVIKILKENNYLKV